jgi:hypothetical protein
VRLLLFFIPPSSCRWRWHGIGILGENLEKEKSQKKKHMQCLEQQHLFIPLIFGSRFIDS